MTRETKVGLLVGMGVILLIGIIISDHLSVVQQQNPAEQMTRFADRAQDSITRIDPPAPSAPPAASAPPVLAEAPTTAAAMRAPQASVLQRVQAVPTPQELSDPNWQPAPDPRGGAGDLSSQQELPLAYRLDRQAPTAEIAQSASPLQTPRIEAGSGPRTGGPRVPMSLEDTSVTQSSQPAQAEIAPLPAPRPASASAAGPGSAIIHYVQPGETLYQIAQKYYGNGEYWRTIAEHNPGRVKPNGQVNQNVRLVVPNRAGLAALGDAFIPVGRAMPHRLTPAVVPDPPKTITVEAGDTLSKLASEHLGSATRWRELFEANKDKLDRPESLRAGMTLELPQPSPPSPRASTQSRVTPSPLRVLAPPVTQTEPRTAEAAGFEAYVVEPGDSLYAIAASQLGDGKRWREVYQANRNRLADPDAVVVGQTLKIPNE